MEKLCGWSRPGIRGEPGRLRGCAGGPVWELCRSRHMGCVWGRLVFAYIVVLGVYIVIFGKVVGWLFGVEPQCGEL